MRRVFESAGMSPFFRASSRQTAIRLAISVKHSSILRRKRSLTPDSSCPSPPSRQPM